MSNVESEVWKALGSELLRRAFAEEESADIERWLLDQLLKRNPTQDEAVMTWLQSFDYYDELLAKRAEESSKPVADRRLLNFPWPTWNRFIDPLDPGMLMVVAAPDGAGKTIYAESIAEHWARGKNHVVFVHYELNRALMLDRRTVRHTGITRRVLKSGLLSAEELATYEKMKPVLKSWDGYITYVHAPGWTMDGTIQELRKQKQAGACDVVVLDYLEKVAPSKRQLGMFGASQIQREADNVEMIKNFAEAHDIPVLMLAQFNKEGKAAGKDVDRTVIRGAGEKTEKANVVVLLQREKVDGGDGGLTYGPAVTVTIDKNTVGATGQVFQNMEADMFRVKDPDNTFTLLEY